MAHLQRKRGILGTWSVSHCRLGSMLQSAPSVYSISSHTITIPKAGILNCVLITDQHRPTCGLHFWAELNPQLHCFHFELHQYSCSEANSSFWVSVESLSLPGMVFHGFPCEVFHSGGITFNCWWSWLWHKIMERNGQK